jgi:hypothetical protein
LVPTQREEETTSSLTARDVGSQATLRSFALTIGKEDDGAPGLVCILSGNCLEQAALRWEQLSSNHRENRATGKEDKAYHRHHMYSPRKRRNGGIPVGYLGRITLRREQYGMQTRC